MVIYNVASGRLVGGPHDGVTFSMNGKWLAREDGFEQPATFLLVDRAGNIQPGWPSGGELVISTLASPFAETPSLYFEDPDDPGHLYRFHPQGKEPAP